ncbi:SRPBCC family protein [Leifsonia sp. Leaf264]|uniref:SRPBCC family protein n=1 Tax=Leifsonia sp. Leaf264 TaxID=1736314 RepID=UPI0006F961FA|nr:SRPBCC domain-containing protein [Leifsonia sp. Leaf264]KQP01741.1 hypothetical protein ASF30_03970 [Leifsonia sp. Leaf264]
MTVGAPAGSPAPAPALVVSRVIAASPEALFDAWTDPSSLAAWMQPGATTHTEVTADARVGGEFSILMHMPDAPVLHRGTYLEVDRPRRLAFTWRSRFTEDADTRVTVDFTATDAGTLVAVTHEHLPHESARAAHLDGWTDCLSELAAWAAPA